MPLNCDMFGAPDLYKRMFKVGLLAYALTEFLDTNSVSGIMGSGRDLLTTTDLHILKTLSLRKQEQISS
ncbi:hypothetical protein J6590_086880 [Homalodisca vitripennis]|nr:hypothetical protein J6590_086880 [Homalodisca vitripennis]